MGFDHWPPYSFKNTPEEGILFPHVQNILSHSGYQVIPQFFPAKRLLSFLKQNKAMDMACNLWRTPERKKLLLFSKPILKNKLGFYAISGRYQQHILLNDLKKFRIGIIRGYDYGEQFDKAQLQPHNLTQTNSAEELFKMLTAGRVDLALSDQRVADWASEIISSTTRFEPVSDVFIARDLHCVVNKKHPKAQQLIEAINAGLD